MTNQEKDHVVFYITRHLIDEPQVPIVCFRCLINGCKRVNKSTFLRAWVFCVGLGMCGGGGEEMAKRV